MSERDPARESDRYSNEQLTSILEQACIYMCACPAQLAKELMGLRELHAYQINCMSTMPTLAATHRCIADAVQRAHVLLEDALDEVLRLEGWDMNSLTMPEGLRKVRDSLL